jgi:hypothetical protein
MGVFLSWALTKQLFLLLLALGCYFALIEVGWDGTECETPRLLPKGCQITVQTIQALVSFRLTWNVV